MTIEYVMCGGYCPPMTTASSVEVLTPARLSGGGRSFGVSGRWAARGALGAAAAIDVDAEGHTCRIARRWLDGSTRLRTGRLVPGRTRNCAEGNGLSPSSKERGLLGTVSLSARSRCAAMSRPMSSNNGVKTKNTLDRIASVSAVLTITPAVHGSNWATTATRISARRIGTPPSDHPR